LGQGDNWNKINFVGLFHYKQLAMVLLKGNATLACQLLAHLLNARYSKLTTL